jgi:hypothetical protein
LRGLQCRNPPRRVRSANSRYEIQRTTQDSDQGTAGLRQTVRAALAEGEGIALGSAFVKEPSSR